MKYIYIHVWALAYIDYDLKSLKHSSSLDAYRVSA